MLLANIIEQKKSSSSDSSKREGKVVKSKDDRSQEHKSIPQPADPTIINELPPNTNSQGLNAVIVNDTSRTSKDLERGGDDPRCGPSVAKAGFFSSMLRSLTVF